MSLPPPPSLKSIYNNPQLKGLVKPCLFTEPSPHSLPTPFRGTFSGERIQTPFSTEDDFFSFSRSSYNPSSSPLPPHLDVENISLSSGLLTCESGVPLTSSLVLSSNVNLSHKGILSILTRAKSKIPSLSSISLLSSPTQGSYYLLNEDQSFAALSLLGNSKYVKDFTSLLSREFFSMREQLAKSLSTPRLMSLEERLLSADAYASLSLSLRNNHPSPRKKQLKEFQCEAERVFNLPFGLCSSFPLSSCLSLPNVYVSPTVLGSLFFDKFRDGYPSCKSSSSVLSILSYLGYLCPTPSGSYEFSNKGALHCALPFNYPPSSPTFMWDLNHLLPILSRFWRIKPYKSSSLCFLTTDDVDSFESYVSEPPPPPPSFGDSSHSFSNFLSSSSTSLSSADESLSVSISQEISTSTVLDTLNTLLPKSLESTSITVPSRKVA